MHHDNFNRRRVGPIRLPDWQRRGLYASVLVLTLSGLAWLALHFLMAEAGDELAQLAPKRWSIRIHTAAALWLLFMVGGLVPLHMRSAWHLRRNRIGGAGLAALLLVLTLTGYLLWYAPEGAARQWSQWLHWALGCAAPVALLLHIAWGRAIHRRHGV
ncbi:MAG: DUF4405 domain-containing protein [Bdellovibrionales bacterium]|nr:DUF4405 domain-containing protein [Ramlibacter sp.]